MDHWRCCSIDRAGEGFRSGELSPTDAVGRGPTVYPWNFSPILPICLFGGAVYASRRLVYAIPFATFLMGDLGIWALTGRAYWAFYSYQPVVYLSVALVATSGFGLRKNPMDDTSPAPATPRQDR